MTTYYFALNVTDKDGDIFYQTFPFEVKNHAPEVVSVYYNHSSTLLRDTEDMKFEVNITDYEDVFADNFSVYVVMQNQETKVNSTSKPQLTYDSSSGNYTGLFSFFSSDELADYWILLEISDTDGGKTIWISNNTNLGNETEAINNPPEVRGIVINNKNITTAPHFGVTDVLNFEFIVTDVEFPVVDIVLLELYHEESGTNLTFSTSAEQGYDLLISANKILVSGSWIITAYAVDLDGAASQSKIFGYIQIDPDYSDLTSIITVGLLSLLGGIIMGAFVIWRYANARINDIRTDLIIKGKGKSKKTSNSSYTEPKSQDNGQKRDTEKSKSSKKSKKSKKRF